MLLYTVLTNYTSCVAITHGAQSVYFMTYVIAFIDGKHSEYSYQPRITFFFETDYISFYKRDNPFSNLIKCVSAYIVSLSMPIFVSNLIKNGIPMVKHSLANAMALENKKKQVTHRKRMSPCDNNECPKFHPSTP